MSWGYKATRKATTPSEPNAENAHRDAQVQQADAKQARNVLLAYARAEYIDAPGHPAALARSAMRTRFVPLAEPHVLGRPFPL